MSSRQRQSTKVESREETRKHQKALKESRNGDEMFVSYKFYVLLNILLLDADFMTDQCLSGS